MPGSWAVAPGRRTAETMPQTMSPMMSSGTRKNAKPESSTD